MKATKILDKEDTKMADRKCSCCGEYYTDNKPHDLEKCVQTCRERAHKAHNELGNAIYDLTNSHDRLLAHLKEKKKKASGA